MNAQGDQATAARWREEARELNRRAYVARRDGDPEYAEQLEAAAIEYDNAAAELELRTPA